MWDRTHCLSALGRTTWTGPWSAPYSTGIVSHFYLSLEGKERGLHPPVGEVQDGLDGVSSTLVDVSFEPGQQGHHNKHPVRLLLTNKSHPWSAHTPGVGHTGGVNQTRPYCLLWLINMYVLFWLITNALEMEIYNWFWFSNLPVYCL